MVTRDKEGYYIMINRSIHQGNITIINTYVPEKWYPLWGGVSWASSHSKRVLTEVFVKSYCTFSPWASLLYKPSIHSFLKYPTSLEIASGGNSISCSQKPCLRTMSDLQSICDIYMRSCYLRPQKHAAHNWLSTSITYYFPTSLKFFKRFSSLNLNHLGQHFLNNPQSSPQISMTNTRKEILSVPV